jgi:hypothetical protein
VPSLQSTVADTLRTWREMDRLLAELPPASPDRESALVAAAACRQAYRRLTGPKDPVPATIDTAQSAVRVAREVMRDIRSRHAQPGL